MKKVGVVTTYSSEGAAGLERYLLEFLKALDKVEDNNEYYIYTKKSSGLKEVLAKEGADRLKVVELGFGPLWKDIGLFFANKSDVYIFNGIRVPLFFSPNKYFQDLSP